MSSFCLACFLFVSDLPTFVHNEIPTGRGIPGRDRRLTVHAAGFLCSPHPLRRENEEEREDKKHTHQVLLKHRLLPIASFSHPLQQWCNIIYHLFQWKSALFELDVTQNQLDDTDNCLFRCSPKIMRLNTLVTSSSNSCTHCRI